MIPISEEEAHVVIRQKIDPPEGTFASVIPALLEGNSVYRKGMPCENYRIYDNGFLIKYEVPVHPNSWSRHALLMANDLRATDWSVVL